VLLRTVVVAVSSGLDNHLDYDDIDLLNEVSKIVKEAFTEAGPNVPSLSDPAWRTAPPAAKVAALLPLAEAYLITDRLAAEMVAERIKQASLDVSASGRWSTTAGRPSHCELQRRRNVPGPRYQPEYPGGYVAVDWETGNPVETSTSEERAA
jgi:hypothetical protein